MSKRWRRPLLLLALFAALGVVTRELPECLALSDDISNDGNVPVVLQANLLERLSALANRSVAASALSVATLDQNSGKLAVVGLDASSPKSARSLLLLLCVQRK